jgi:hypothetical protein
MKTHILNVFMPTNYFYNQPASMREILEKECDAYISFIEFNKILQENGFLPNKKGFYKLKPYCHFRQKKIQKMGL